MSLARLFVILGLVLISTTVSARADLNIFLGDLNHRAYAAPADYNLRLSTQFGVPQPQVTTLLRSVAVPADAFMILQLAQMLGLSHDRVLHTYNTNRGKGWGEIAKQLGIKPGSAQFHALKRGEYALTGVPGGKGHGKDKGQDKDHGFGFDLEQPGKGNGPEMSGQGKGKGKGHNK